MQRLHSSHFCKNTSKYPAPKVTLNHSSAAILSKAFQWPLLCLWTHLWHSSPQKRGIYWFGSEALSGVCSGCFRNCVIAHHCTSHKINIAVLLYSQHSSDPNPAPCTDRRVALGCLTYNDAQFALSSKKTYWIRYLSKSYLPCFNMKETLTFYDKAEIYLNVSA